MAYTKEQARAQVEALAANIRVNAGSLAVVPEAQIEDKYICKLFRYLRQAALASADRWNREGCA